MKRIKADIEKWLDKLDDSWRALSLNQQHKYILYFFAGYALLTTWVVLKVCFDMAGSDNNIEIGHIENTPLKDKEHPACGQDTLSTILKNKIYERE